MPAYCDTPAVLRLEQTDSAGNVTASLDLMDQANGYRVASFDLAFPTVREVTAALPTRDGDYDTTALFGPRVVTVAGSLIGSAAGVRQQAWQTLAHWLQPRLRPRLVYQVDPGMPQYAITLRGSQLAAPFADRNVSAFSASWVAPDPVAHGLVQYSAVVQPQSVGAVAGRTYPLTYPRTYPALPAGGSGMVTVTNNGNYPTWPTFRIFGPCTGPAVWWVVPASGAVVFTTGLSVAAGDYLEVSTFDQTAYTNGLATSSQYNYLDFTQTVWQPFYAGNTTIRFAPATWSPPCQLLVLWNDATL
jgi:hypothetical protein